MTQDPNVIISSKTLVDVSQLPAEIVERKGLGHPDTITDMLGALISSNYSKYTLQNFNQIFHHNIDKISLTGGRARVDFGKGEIIEPIHIDFIGRAVRDYWNGKKLFGVPIYNLGAEACKAVFGSLSPDIVYKLDTSKIKRGSDDLVGTFELGREKQVPNANDTSFATAWAPLSPLEQMVLDVENFLNSDYRIRHPYIGTDIKVMGRRMGEKIWLTIAVAFIGPKLSGIEDYKEGKEKLREAVANRTGLPIEDIWINMADDYEKNIEYITVTGTSAEQGDDGQIGRGNRVLGIISPFRPQTLEAVAGKNPNSHVGNFYNVWAAIISKRVHEELGLHNNVVLVSTIGKPITTLDSIITFDKSVDKSDNRKVNDIVKEVVNSYADITNRIIEFDFDDLYPFNLIKKYVLKK